MQAIVASTPVSSDSYTHIAGTWNWDGTKTVMRIYVNAIEDAPPQIIADRLESTSRALRVGGSVGTPIKGIVDEVLAYDRALSNQEIAALLPPPDEGPVLYFDMETLTADGRMDDLSGNGHHGTIAGTTDFPGKVGQGRGFDGIDDVIQSPSFPRSANGTFALWVKPDVSQAPPSSGAYPQILSFDGDPGIYIQANTGRPYLQIVFPAAGVQAVVASSPVSSDSYTHIAGTWKWDGTNTIVGIYVNGVVDAVPLSIPDHLGLSSRTLRVGSSGGTPIKGIVDEVLVYDRALSDQEILSLQSGSTQASLYFVPSQPSGEARPMSITTFASETMGTMMEATREDVKRVLDSTGLVISPTVDEESKRPVRETLAQREG